MQDKTLNIFSAPLYVMLKPVGAQCNLACTYCYYLGKQKLYPVSSRMVMSDETLENFTRMYLESQTTREVLFTWHGGEATIRPLSFYKKAVELQKKYAGGHIVENSLQTNGTMLTDEWCEFLAKNHWLVGVSIDGPEEYHDKFRRTRQDRGSFNKVMQGIRLLNKHGVEWNAMAVVNRINADHPLEFYNFFKSIGCHYIQFTPIVEEKQIELSVTPSQWADFCIAIFDQWVKTDVGEYFVQLFDATLANWVGVAPGVCSLAKQCGHAGAMEWNGDVYACDHFVAPEYKRGNIAEKSLIEMMYSPEQQQFGRNKYESLPKQCKECRFLFACNGECPKNRFCKTAEGESGLNYLCEGYYRFFEHVAPYMDIMRKELEAGRPPSNVMSYVL